MRKRQVNRFFIIGLALYLAMVLPSVSWAIDEAAARKIAEDAAGCSSTQPCQTRARFDNGQWVLVVWFIYGYRDNGEPIFTPGGWVGFTINQEGLIVDRIPGL